ncbi:uncharacterized protein PHALS_12015 [Plasmopara halstedii]|uniref:Uncharacterized protein n=1 Tax=Plasmopara halstedii TaxID=4781 RepID=A0A0P1AKB6_PLAHL|nr:uncharacterized protein PHALS_12015 [Plasmopara halstedii]CEG41680.1 hypothetical protein PHALS_12015 [Plasmopara halstedii]|eukprot:XP_024578049.1 hypothetical protein PHALS_12015 [Plasmopara halstedii]
MNYLSCLKVKGRQNTTTKYVAYAQKEGITLQNTADDITDEILRLLCEQMFQ